MIKLREGTFTIALSPEEALRYRHSLLNSIAELEAGGPTWDRRITREQAIADLRTRISELEALGVTN